MLPASVYAGAARAVQRRHVPVGLQHQQRRRLLAGAHHRGQAERRHDGDLHQQPRQHAPAEAADGRPVAPLGRSARHHRANNCVNGPPLAAPCTQPYAGPIPTVVHLHGAEVLSQYDGHPDAWFTPGFAAEGTGVRHQHLQLPEPAGGDDALVPRPRARRRAPERLRRPRGLLLHPRQPRHRPRQQPDHAARRARRKPS